MQASELLSLIKQRRTCYQFELKNIAPVTEETLEMCLEAAIWAPNHKLTQPWRFWVLSEQSLSVLAPLYAKLRADKRAEPDSEAYRLIFQSAIEKFQSFPKVIFVGQVLAENEKTRKEDYAACACAIQNLQLMAWQLGIGVQWSTGPILDALETYDFLNINPKEIELVGILYIGFLKGDCSTKNGKRKPLKDLVQTI